MTLADLDPPNASRPSEQFMQLVGFPGGKVVIEADKRAVSPTFYQWTGDAVEERDFKKRGRTRDHHVLFAFDRAQAVNRDGVPSAGPDLKGASGSGIWRMLPIGEDLKWGRWALLTAVFTDFEGKTIIGTHVRAHLALIEKHFPESKVW
jgi:hypothetical protein